LIGRSSTWMPKCLVLLENIVDHSLELETLIFD
jgi:hypothetical protein